MMSETQHNQSDWIHSTKEPAVDSDASFATPWDTLVVSSDQTTTVYSIQGTDIFVGFLQSLIALAAIIGNLLVILSVRTNRKLRTITNLFVVSLAFSDLMVGSLVLPFAIKKHVTKTWYLSKTLCDIHISLDVLLCTASILNLCCISIDRYFAITRPLVCATKRNKRLAMGMIAAVWIVSAVITIPPLLGWKDSGSNNGEKDCELTDAKGYVIYSAMGSFYIPLAIVLFVYANIFVVARDANRRRTLHSYTSISLPSSKPGEDTLPRTTPGGKLSGIRPKIMRVTSHASVRYLCGCFGEKRWSGAESYSLSVANERTVSPGYIQCYKRKNEGGTDAEQQSPSDGLDARPRTPRIDPINDPTNINHATATGINDAKLQAENIVSTAIPEISKNIRDCELQDLFAAYDEWLRKTADSHKGAPNTTQRLVWRRHSSLDSIYRMEASDANGKIHCCPNDYLEVMCRNMRHTVSIPTYLLFKEDGIQKEGCAGAVDGKQVIVTGNSPKETGRDDRRHSCCAHVRHDDPQSRRLSTEDPSKFSCKVALTASSAVTESGEKGKEESGKDGKSNGRMGMNSRSLESMYKRKTSRDSERSNLGHLESNAKADDYRLSRTRNSLGNVTMTSTAAKHLSGLNQQRTLERRENSVILRENRTVKTVSIVVGCFVLCWLPFFIAYISNPFLPVGTINEHLFRFFEWLGYFNSVINPFIYALYNEDFRMTFWHLTLGRVFWSRCLPKSIAPLSPNNKSRFNQSFRNNSVEIPERKVSN